MLKLKFAKVEDKVSQVMVKKVNKPITTTQIVIMINQPKVQRRKRNPLSMFYEVSLDLLANFPFSK